jgi:serine protease AprX
LNRTVKAPAWPGVLAEIAADDAVSTVDLPRRIVREAIVVGGVTGAPEFRSRTGSIGADVVVAIIDSEIDASHPALAGRVVRRRNFTDEPWGYPDMHGTAVDGIVGASSPQITGIAPDVMIYLYKVLATNAYLTGTDFDGARALQLAVEDGADVANISWGVGPASNGQSREARAVDAAWALGMTVVKSAGNRGPWLRTLTSPADASGVIVVGATDVGGTGVQAYSSRGPLPNGEHRPHLVAPGGSGRNGVVS